ncbi:MAG: double-strand break repair protein AddB [Bradyrhizobiaceae bacterium]|nr:double-strand break repair protein AddB [Bradyrhizobiaceae bacterium]
MNAKPRVFTISPSTPFLPTLARALLDGVLIPGFSPRGDPFALAGATVYLPTRRAARSFAEALLAELGTDAALLPRILPLGDADEDALAFADVAGLPETPAPISPGARRLALAQLVLKFAETTAAAGRPLVAASPAAALQLVDELARLFDDLTIAGVPFDALDAAEFIPPNLDEYWQRSLEFLKIARKGWDDHLREHGLADPAVWQDLLLAREAERLKQHGGPVIAAGSTGTIPAVARLIATIAKLEQGAVVLPGLDQTLDDVSFALIEDADRHDPSPGHPQFGLKRLIARIGIARSEVVPLGEALAPGRDRFLSEAFRPAATTDRWRERGADFDRRAAAALQGVYVIEAADPRAEALALAVALRETLETPGETASLITPDRTLARRVAAELRRWNIEIDDSAGVALEDSDAGRLARLAASVAAEGFEPVTLLALLRHPLADLRLPRRAVDALELAALRGPRPAPGADGLKRAIADARARAEAKRLHRRDPRMKLSPADWDMAAKLAARLPAALEPLLRLAARQAIPFGELVAAHRAALENLGVDFTKREPEDVRALALAFEHLAEAAGQAPRLSLSDYADAFPQLLAGEPPVRPPFDRMARIRILGPLEARLLDADRVLLGGLNEGTWPPEAHADAWLNRPMRRTLKLDLPERRIGLTAHDFAQAVGAREVIVSRAKKQDGVEMVASRFLQRLKAVTPGKTWEAAVARGKHYLDLANALESTDEIPAAKRPAPKPPAEVRPAPTPPAEVRPARLSVTEIETLVRDPYSIYARHILKLDPLEEIDADPGVAERGTILHEAFAEFTKAAAGPLPKDALEQLVAAGRKAFAAIEDYPGLRAIWWPRFLRAAEWLVSQEETLRAEIDRIFAETSGAIEFDAGGRPFKLTARADRIDLHRDGTVAIIDYKTGTPPGLRETLIGLSPQLPLEAAIAKAGGFRDVPNVAGIADIIVLALSGGHPPGKIVSFDPVNATREAKAVRDALNIATCDDLAAVARTKVEELIKVFADASTPYRSIPRPKWRGRFGQYDHLARIKEWSANDRGEE